MVSPQARPDLRGCAPWQRAGGDASSLRPRAAWIVAGLIVAILMRHFWLDEGTLPNILFTAGVTLALIALAVLLTRRVLFATTLMATAIAVLVVVAATKRALMNMVLHAYDIFFYLSSWATVSYLWSDHRRYLLGLAAALLASAFMAWLSYCADTTRVPRRWAALAVLLCACLGLVRRPRQGRAPPHAVLLREPLRLLLLCILGRDHRGAVARRAAGGGAAGGVRGQRLHHPGHLQGRAPSRRTSC